MNNFDKEIFVAVEIETVTFNSEDVITDDCFNGGEVPLTDNTEADARG